MTLLSPSIVRMERPINECISIMNTLGCESIHVDTFQGITMPNFFNLASIRNGVLRQFNARVTLHIFQLENYTEFDLSFLRETDIAVLHLFPKTADTLVSAFLKEVLNCKCRAGVAIDLETNPLVIKSLISNLDTIFIMGIPVATSGLDPDASTENRIDEIVSLKSENSLLCRIGLDGGVNSKTFARYATKVNELVIGGLLFGAPDIKLQWKALNEIINP